MVRLAGLALTLVYGAFIVWLYAAQPQTVSQVTGGLASGIGVYQVDQQATADALAFFRRDAFVEARAAFERADPARRDARTQFYIAYSYYRQGWGRVYNDDVLFKQGIDAVDRAIALAPAHRLVVDDVAPRHEKRRRAQSRARARHDARRVGFQPVQSLQSPQMTPVREAIVLPAMFLTVALFGGLRIADTVRLVPPPLISLVLAMLLVAALVRSGALAPDRLMNAQRAPLENVSGILVLIALFAASAQIFNLLTPEIGLLHAVFSACFFVQLATTLAGVSGRTEPAAQPRRAPRLRARPAVHRAGEPLCARTPAR